MELFIVPPKHIDTAWRDGAFRLDEACQKSGSDITGDQLKLMLARGERILACIKKDAYPVGWVVFDFIQYPNTRSLFIYELYAPRNAGAELMEKLTEIAKAEGCSSIRGACDEVGERLWKDRFKAKRLYAVCEVDLWAS